MRRTWPHEPLLLLADCSALTEGAGPGLPGGVEAQMKLTKTFRWGLYFTWRSELSRSKEGER